MKNLKQAHKKRFLRNLVLVGGLTGVLTTASVSFISRENDKKHLEDIREKYTQMYTVDKVQAGETLSEIVEEYMNDPQYDNKDVYRSNKEYQDAVCVTNNMVNPNALEYGKELLIPYYVTNEKAAVISANTDAKNSFYVVEHSVEGLDTLSDLAHKYGIDSNYLSSYNGIQKGDILPINTSIKIPTTVEKAIENGDLPTEYLEQLVTLNQNSNSVLMDDEEQKGRTR